MKELKKDPRWPQCLVAICAVLVWVAGMGEMTVRGVTNEPPVQMPDPFGPPDMFGGPPPGMPPGFFPPPPFGGEQERKVLSGFDTNKDGWLNQDERKAARASLAKTEPRGRQPGGPPNAEGEKGTPGPAVSPAEVKPISGAGLYASNVLRTVFLEFEEQDWEQALEEFHGTDVDVMAKLMIDGVTYSDVGVRFRGASSYSMIQTGQKRSLNISMDAVHENQSVLGYRTLNLLNAHEDPSFLRSVLYLDIARTYIPAPRANFVRLVINGESWGLYVSVEQFNKDFVQEWFGTRKGARWKVQGSPNGQGSLAYLGTNYADYKRIYTIKSKDTEASWKALVQLCRVLNETPADQLEATLKPLLDVDGALKFLALENVFINADGYWTRASDYDLYLDTSGCFHVIPYDANETFNAMMGGPGFGGPGGPFERGNREKRSGGNRTGSAVALDPLLCADNPDRPLISKLLAVPALRTRYLSYVREMATQWLDWEKLGPAVSGYQQLITPQVKADTRKLYSCSAFEQSFSDAKPAAEMRGPGPRLGLKAFAQQRRAYLLALPDVAKATQKP